MSTGSVKGRPLIRVLLIFRFKYLHRLSDSRIPDLALVGLLSKSDSVKKMTAGTVTRLTTNQKSVLSDLTNQRPAYLDPPTTAPESICSSSLEMVATERAEL